MSSRGSAIRSRRKRTYRPRRYATYKGRGDYTKKRRATAKPRASSNRSLVRDIIKGIVGAGAPLAGGMLGGPAGAAMGSVAAGIFNSAIGNGDYTVNYNTLYNAKDAVPNIQNGPNRSTIVRHREYIGDVISSGTTGAFSLASYPLNPGLVESFPWFAGVANNYDEWRPHGMIYTFKTASGSVTTSQSLGTVIMATQYNVNDPVFTTKQQMENYQFGCSTVPSQSLMHPIECDPRQTTFGTMYNVRDGPAVGDKRLYDIGTFQIATQGIPGSSVNLGELWLSFEIELLKPQMSQTDVDAPEEFFSILSNGGGATGQVYMGTRASSVVTKGGDFEDWDFDFDNQQLIIPVGAEPGDFMLMYASKGSPSATGCHDPFWEAVEGDITGRNAFFGTDTQISNLYDQSTTSQFKSLFFFEVLNTLTAIAKIGISGSLLVLPFPVTAAELFVVKLPANLIDSL